MTAPDSRDSVAEQLRALVALAEKATPGEWRAEEENADYSGGGQWYDLRVGDRNPFWYPYNGPGSDGSREKANADFVVAAVNFIRTHGPEVLQALARGPQQADSLVNPEDSLVTQAGKDKLLGRLDLMADHGWRAPREAAVRIRALQAEVDRLREQLVNVREAFDLKDAAFRLARDAANDLQAALREAGKDTERLDWMQPHVLAQWRGSAGSHTLLDHDGRAFLGSSLRAAIDQGMRDWRSDAALNGGQDDNA